MNELKIENATHKKIMTTTEDYADVLYFAFRHAMGRKTFAPELVVKSIIKNWAIFEKFERDVFVTEIQREVVCGGYGSIAQWLQWKKILRLAKVDDETVEVLEIKVITNERRKANENTAH